MAKFIIKQLIRLGDADEKQLLDTGEVFETHNEAYIIKLKPFIPEYLVPVDEVPVDEVPIDEVPIEEVPIEEVPIEETLIVDKVEEPAGGANVKVDPNSLKRKKR
jgi:hypothetical protein